MAGYGLAGSGARIVSLLPSATEIVCALGFERSLVGRSHECDFPPTVAHLPVFTAPRFATDGSSREIDDRVRRIVSSALSVYSVDAERLRAANPDVIVTQSHCEVCAVSLAEVERALAQWSESPPLLVVLAPSRLADVWSDMERVAAALGVPERGRELVAKLKARMVTVAQKAGSLAERPTVACIEWTEPLMAAANWMPELVEMGGGQNLFGNAGERSPRFGFDELLGADPDVILAAPCGLGIERTLDELRQLAGRSEWASLRAVRERRTFVADGSQFFNRPGPRLVESLEILGEILHPQVFHFGHEGSAWRRV